MGCLYNTNEYVGWFTPVHILLSMVDTDMFHKFSMNVFILALVSTVAAEIGCLFRSAALIVRFGSVPSVCAGVLLGNFLLLLPLLFEGEWIHKSIPPSLAKWISGLVIIAIGIFILMEKDK